MEIFLFIFTSSISFYNKSSLHMCYLQYNIQPILQIYLSNLFEEIYHSHYYQYLNQHVLL